MATQDKGSPEQALYMKPGENFDFPIEELSKLTRSHYPNLRDGGTYGRHGLVPAAPPKDQFEEWFYQHGPAWDPFKDKDGWSAVLWSE